MSKILIINDSELVLTYTWNKQGHKISGHIFEVIDYYMILNNIFKTKILFIGLTKNELMISLEKYNFNDKEINNILENTIFHNNHPKIIRCKNILFTDGDIITMNLITFLCDNVFLFACGNKEVKNNENKKYHILQDDRIYDKVKVNGINYKKKILFDRLKVIDNLSNILMYCTGNCRLYDKEKIKNYILSQKSQVILLVDTDYYDELSNICNIQYTPFKINNIKKYVYTPISRKWDCSPRLIAECAYFNIEVEYLDIDYLEEDKGLYFRKLDIEENFESLHLKLDDPIIEILTAKFKKE